MTNQQIASKLQSSGFDAKVVSSFSRKYVRVSLNRRVTISEVQATLDIPSEMFIRSGKNVLVSGIDS